MREIHIRDNLGDVFVYDGQLSTGLYDINNVEIFEGDWVKTLGYDKVRKVVWMNCGLYLQDPHSPVLMGIMPGCEVVEVSDELA